MVVLLGFANQSVEFVVENPVPEVVGGSSSEAVILDDFLNPLLECEETQDVTVGNALLEVGIFNTITRVGECNTSSIGTEFVHRVLEGQEVSGALAHLVTIQEQVSVSTDTTRPVLWREESNVDVEEESQVVLNQILSRYTDVHGVPVFEFSSQR